MNTSLDTLISDLMDAMGDTLTTGTVDSGNTTTMVDAARTESDDEWVNAWLRIDTDAGSVAPEGEERRITDFVASSDTMTLFPALTAGTAIGDTYSIREIFSYDQYKKAVNHAIRMATEWWPEVKVTVPVEAAGETGTATSATATSLTNSGASWTADALIGRHVTIYEGTGAGQEPRLIVDNTTTKLVVPTWDTTPDTTSKYRIEKTGRTHLVICSQQMDYPLPPGTKHIYEAWVESPATEESATATAATTTTLTDSGQSWTADEHIGRYIVIYDGTGKGQPSRLITDNTTTAVTVATWAIEPSTDSKYKIKKSPDVAGVFDSQASPWSRIYHAYIDIGGGYMRFPGQHTEGAWVRLKYETDPSTLSLASDTTGVPEEYILLKAAGFLWQRKRKDNQARWWAQWSTQQADSYAATHRRRKPYGTIWRFDDGETTHAWDSPFRPN